ncbi:zinc ribbon domain-containing protein [Breznakiellaceae bacterium SP9]
MENMVFCQSCGMPLSKDDDFGTNADGIKNRDYCAYCYKDGKFTQDLTMEGMIEVCVPFMVEANKDMTAETARKSMQEWFPTLKRWKTA